MWLTVPGPVLLKRMDRSSKYDTMVEKVDLISYNPHYALVKLPHGSTKNVPIHALALRGDTSVPSTSESPLVTSPNDLPRDQSTSADFSDSLKIHNANSVQTHTDPRDDSLSEILSLQHRTRAYRLRNREV
ncbi:hypothetical protein FGIG_07366 [Fasciola gigantica]|uniref:Uncharacterized protein n=1 Tax=Fasciola gigantica TaxID=46835 RepID=A0A504YZ69_FASGI|nr:hypothetical protein FGIG_07366 [Fasciola gigantica]